MSEVSLPVNTARNEEEARGEVLARRPWLVVVQGVWLVAFSLALFVVILSLPGYRQLADSARMHAVAAPPIYIAAVYGLTAFASFGTVVLCLGLSVLLFWRKRHDTMALLTSFFLLAYGIAWGGALELALGAYQSDTGRILADSIGGTLTFIPLVLILFLFPSGRFVPRWTRWVVLTTPLLLPLFYLIPQLALNFSDSLALGLQMIVALVAGVGLAAQIYRYLRVSNVPERQQTKWFVGGLFLAIMLGFLSSLAYPMILSTPPDVPLPWWVPLAQLNWSVAIAIIPLSLTIAVMRYRFFDIDLILNRTLVYGTLTVVVIGSFILATAALGALFHAAEGSSNLLIALLVTAAVAVLFQPLRERVQRAVNRLTYGERDDPYRVLTLLGVQLETAMEPSTALTQTVEIVAAALKLPYVAIALRKDSILQIVASRGAATKTVRRFPLLYGGEPFGELIAAPRSQNEALTPADERLLRDLARQISISARTVALTTDLEQARLRIVTERGEARRQLGSDLHDGVGHQLVALTRQIESVMPKLPDESVLIPRQFLVDIKQQIVAATTQVRNLSHQLYPPELEILGLNGALRERIHAYSTFKVLVDVPGTMPPLPAEIEMAAYYIALEALTNVDKHAQAHVCHVRLTLSSADPRTGLQRLELEVADDGQGRTAHETHGLGLLSMRARAIEVGGTCEIMPNPGGGTVVWMQVPCTLKVQ